MERAWLNELETSLASEQEDLAVALVTLAAVAGADIAMDEDELRASGRRALFVLAAGGDPTRGLDLDGPAVERLAADLDDPQRRESLEEGLERLEHVAGGLPHVSEVLHGLRDAPETAWRAYACSLLAEALADTG